MSVTEKTSRSNVQIDSRAPVGAINERLGSVKVLSLEDADKAAVTLLQAFVEDSLSKLLLCHVSDRVLREKLEFELYRAYIKQHILKGICVGIGEAEDSFETVGVWALPDSEDRGLDSFGTMMQSGFGKLWENLDLKGRDKVFDGLLPLLHNTCEEIMLTDPRFLNKNVYTLVYLGSVARARGKGNTRLMFEFMFKNYIDAEPDNITYLESSSAANLPIYERFGFRSYREIILGKKEDNYIEGIDYAVMNVMIRGPNGETWVTKNNDVLNSSSKL